MYQFQEFLTVECGLWEISARNHGETLTVFVPIRVNTGGQVLDMAGVRQGFGRGKNTAFI